MGFVQDDCVPMAGTEFLDEIARMEACDGTEEVVVAVGLVIIEEIFAEISVLEDLAEGVARLF